LIGLWLALVFGAPSVDEPDVATLAYYNARMALREGDPEEALKLWLLRNSLAQEAGTVGVHDADFHSVTWAALGDIGICQDGIRTDETGAGLWPLALHNWIVKNMRRRVRRGGGPKPFRAFQLGQQQRFFAVGDVLSTRELEAVDFFKGRCSRQRWAIVAAGETVTAELSDKQVTARVLSDLLVRAEESLGPDVRGTAALAARRFDLQLTMAELAAREARREGVAKARQGRLIGMSRAEVQVMGTEQEGYTFADDSEPARILKASATWSIDEWMTLSPDRRIVLFDHASAYVEDPERWRTVALGILDRLVAQGEGVQVRAWIARVDRSSEDTPPEVRDLVVEGERGRALLGLGEETDFGERSVVALHRGVNQLGRGEMMEALASFALAMSEAPASSRSDQVSGLARRWLSYVTAQFEISEDLLVTLEELVPRRDYDVIVEDLMWKAALHADAGSFDKAAASQQGRGATRRRMDLLRPLARGDIGGMANQVQERLEASPSETLRFLELFLQQLEREGADVRSMHIPTLLALREVVRPVSSDGEGEGRRARTADGWMVRSQGLLEGLDQLADGEARDRARSVAPGAAVFAGSVRVAPADPLPWPFLSIKMQAPSVFEPMELTPIEWVEDDELVFGWRIRG